MLSRALSVWRLRAKLTGAGIKCAQWRLGVHRSYAKGAARGKQGARRNRIEYAKSEDGGLPGGTAADVHTVPTALLGVVVTDQAQKTSLEQLLDQIKPHQNLDSGTVAQLSRLAILLTPAFAQHASDEHLPSSLLRQLNRGPLPLELEATTAVIDRLPDGSSDGQEGLAYILDRDASPLSDGSSRPFNPAAQKPGSIYFQTSRNGAEHGLHTIQVPLAHTVFSTGMISTLHQSHFSFDRVANRLQMQNAQFLETKTLRLPLIAHGSPAAVALHVPVTPLTPLRVVLNCMGNIVRALSRDTSVEEPWLPLGSVEANPASLELEQAVSSYFKAFSMPPEAVNVWALIIPRHRFSSYDQQGKHPGGHVSSLARLTPELMRQYWKADYEALGKQRDFDAVVQEAIDAVIQEAIMDGGRFCRVLSGGGGWGKKAGLLSLDPDAEYSSRDLRHDQGWEFDFSDESEAATKKQQQEALGRVVEEGEHIMFFLAPREYGMAEEVRMNNSKLLSRAERAVLFGAVPSSIDTVPTTEHVNSSEAEPSPVIRHITNVFGALSEGGMAFTCANHDGNTKTKFDVPYGYVRVMESMDDSMAHGLGYDERPSSTTRSGSGANWRGVGTTSPD